MQLYKLAKSISVLLLAICSSWLAAQQCIEQPNFDQRQKEPVFVDLADGTVLELRSRLMWLRCNLGQEFQTESQSCEGSPAFQHYELILEQVDELEYRGYDNWRVPSNSELRSVLRVACAEDASLTALADFVSERYWTTTRDYYDNAKFQAVDFSDGYNDYLFVGLYAYSRPVRSLSTFEQEKWDELLEQFDANEKKLIYGVLQPDGSLELHSGAPCPRC